MTFLLATIGNYCSQTMHIEKPPERTLLSPAQMFMAGLDTIAILTLVGFVIYSVITQDTPHSLMKIDLETSYILGGTAATIALIDLSAFAIQSHQKYAKAYRNLEVIPDYLYSEDDYYGLVKAS